MSSVKLPTVGGNLTRWQNDCHGWSQKCPWIHYSYGYNGSSWGRDTHTHTHARTQPIIICPLFAYFRWLLFIPCKWLRGRKKKKTLAVSSEGATYCLTPDSFEQKQKRNCHILLSLITTSDYPSVEMGGSLRCMCEQYPGRGGRWRSGSSRGSGLFVSAALRLRFVYRGR